MKELLQASIQHQKVQGMHLCTPFNQRQQELWLSDFLSFHQSEKKEISNLLASLDGTSNKSYAHYCQKKIKSIGDRRKQYLKLIAPIVSKSPDEIEKMMNIAAMPVANFIFKYPKNIFRDWVWGDEETQKNLEVIRRIIPTKKYHNHLCLGAGSCRWPWEIHQELSIENTYCFDLNPLLLTCGQKLLSGKSFKLIEIMDNPKEGENLQVQHHLKFPQKADDHFHFILGDFFQDTFKEQSFDLISSPWFIDILDHPPQSIFKRINHLLSDQGLWLNFGPYSFKNWHPESLLEEARNCGFEILHHEIAELPYLQSPHEAQKRIENVLFFVAKKTEHRQLDNLDEVAWIADTTRPIPVYDHWQQEEVAHAIYTFVYQQINGKHSIDDVAKLVESNFGLEFAQARASLMGFLQKQV